MKKILLITENLGSGGAERQLVGLAALLTERGFDVTVLTYFANQFYEPFLKEKHIQYIYAPQLLNKWTRVGRLAKIIKKLAPDVVISFLPSVNISVCLTRLLTNYKLIVSERSHTLKFGIKTKLQFLLYHMATHVVANSYSEAQNIAEHFPLLRLKTLAIPNYVDLSRFSPVNLKEKRNGSIRLLCVGRIIPTKNVLRFIEALASVVKEGYKVECKWVGSMYDRVYCEAVKRRIRELDMEKHFILQNQTDDIVNEYHQADIFCLPSLIEGYPNVLVEAMSCGLPVVCSNVFENPRIIRESINGYLFDPKDTNDMSNAIKKCLSLMDTERQSIGRYNRLCITKNNSSEAFVKQYISLFD